MDSWGDIIDAANNEDFVGREAQLAIFRREIRNPKSKELIFYISGQGGVGKTRLLNQYRQIAEDAEFVTASSDEQQPDVPSILGHFAQQLKAADHKLKAFDDQYKTYRRLRDEIETDPAAPLGLAGMLARTSFRLGMGLLDELPVARQVSKLVSDDMRTEAGTQISEYADYLSKKTKNNKDEIALMNDPIRVLAPIFFQDLNRIAAKDAVILTFDNYEFTRRYLDKWLTQLHTYRPSQNVRIIIAGRDNPGPIWDKLKSVILQIRLDVFTVEEADNFLDIHNVTDAKRRELILEYSNRLPVLMDWLASAEGNDNDSALPTANIVDRFLQWVPTPELRQVALRLTIPRFFNLESVQLLMEHDSLPASEDDFNWLCQLPPVSQREKGWQYHDVVRRLMLQHQRQTSEQAYRTLHLKLADHYDQRIQELSLQSKEKWSNERWQNLTLEYLYHHVAGNPDKHWTDFLSTFVIALHEQRSFGSEVLNLFFAPSAKDELTAIQKKTIDILSEQLEHIRNGKLSDGLDMFNLLLKIHSLSQPAQVILYAYLGEAHRQKKAYEIALPHFEKSIELDPEFEWVIRSRGLTYLHQGQYEMALTDFSHIIKLNPDLEWVYYHRGETNRLMKQYEEAIADFNHAIKLKPEYPWAFAARGLTYRQKEEYEKSLIDFNHAIELKPEFEWAFAQRGVTHRQKEQYEEAIIDFNHAMKLNPKYEQAIAQRGITYRQMKQYEEALADLNQAINLKPEYAVAISQRGVTYRQMGQYEKALINFSHAIKLKPESEDMLASRAYTYQMMERYKKALTDLNQAIELKPGFEWALAHRGLIYGQLDQNNEALTDFNYAIEIKPDYRWAFYGRSLIHLKLNQINLATADLHQAITLAQTDYEKDPANWRNILNLAFYHLAADNLTASHPLYDQAHAAPSHSIRDAITDLNDFLTLFPDRTEAQTIRTQLQSYLDKPE